MNYHKIEKSSIANGTGIRVVLWVSGCSIGCYNCHNPETWDFDSGKLFDDGARNELFEALDKPYIQGITFSGGHPLEQENLSEVYDLILKIKEQFPQKDIWLYTGLTLSIEDFKRNNNSLINCILAMCDIVVDGRYIDGQRDITLSFCGSKNQRIIDVKKSLIKNEIILWNDQ